MAKIPRFEVLSLTPLTDAGALKAYATVRVSNLLTIREVRLIQDGDNAPWCSLPQKTWQDETGRKRYSTLVEFHEPDWRRALTEAVMQALREHPDGIKSASASGTPFGRELRQRTGLAGNGRQA